MRRSMGGMLGALALAGVLAVAQGAGAVPITSGGLTQGWLCNNEFLCAGGIGNFTHQAPQPEGLDPADGEIELDIGDLALSFDIDVASATFTGSLGGVDEVRFTNLNYGLLPETALSVTALGNGQFQIDGGQEAIVTGTYQEFLGGSPVDDPKSLDTPASITAGLCDTTDGFLLCTMNFGPFILNPLDIDGTPQVFRHTVVVDPILAPEPAAGALLGVGLLGLWTRRRS